MKVLPSLFPARWFFRARHGCRSIATKLPAGGPRQRVIREKLDRAMDCGPSPSPRRAMTSPENRPIQDEQTCGCLAGDALTPKSPADIYAAPNILQTLDTSRVNAGPRVGEASWRPDNAVFCMIFARPLRRTLALVARDAPPLRQPCERTILPELVGVTNRERIGKTPKPLWIKSPCQPVFRLKTWWAVTIIV